MTTPLFLYPWTLNRCAYETLSQYWEGQGDHLYAALSRYESPNDALLLTPAEVTRLLDVIEDVLDNYSEDHTAQEINNLIEAGNDLLLSPCATIYEGKGSDRLDGQELTDKLAAYLKATNDDMLRAYEEVTLHMVTTPETWVEQHFEAFGELFVPDGFEIIVNYYGIIVARDPDEFQSFGEAL